MAALVLRSLLDVLSEMRGKMETLWVFDCQDKANRILDAVAKRYKGLDCVFEVVPWSTDYCSLNISYESLPSSAINQVKGYVDALVEYL
jgi:uncharacterized lipoprotein YehR (DUF1307 family)